MSMYWKGQLIQHLPADWVAKDMGMCYGTGLFETCAVNGGKVLLLQQHVDRLAQSIAVFGWQEPANFEALAADIEKYLSAMDAKKGVLRLFYSPGVREAGQWDWDQASICLQFEAVELAAKPLRIACKDHQANPMMKHKTRSYLAYLNTLKGPVMPLLCEGDQVLELPIANVAFFQGDSLIFPEGNLLAGVMQQYLMQLDLPFEWRERKIYKEELAAFDEICALNSVRGIMEIESFQDYPHLKSGEKTAQLQEICKKHLAFD